MVWAVFFMVYFALFRECSRSTVLLGIIKVSDVPACYKPQFLKQFLIAARNVPFCHTFRTHGFFAENFLP